MRYALEVKNLCFSYRENVSFISDLSFKLEAGKYLCVVGHNGSGKSTFSKLISGLLSPDSGIINIFNQPIKKSNYHRLFEHLGVIFQNPDSQFITSSPEDELAFGLENKKVPTSFMKEIVLELLRSFNLSSLSKKTPSVLSGGEKQRVAIASILAFNPSIFLFDESSSMLAPIEKIELSRLIKTLSSVYGKTVISITHDMEELLSADEIVVFSNGKIVEHFKDKRELFRKPISFFREFSLNLPFIFELGKKLSEEHGLNIPYFSDEWGLIKSLSELSKLEERRNGKIGDQGEE